MDEDRDLVARTSPDLADDGVPATEEVLDELVRTGDSGVGDMPVPDEPWGSEEWGTTQLEERLGESLDGRLSREIPDGPERPLAAGARLYEPGDGDDESFVDVEPDLVGVLDIGHDDMLSPEEAAMTVRDSAPGGTYNDSPGYLDDDA